MKALRWIVFGIVLALFATFAINNWVPVPVVLPRGDTVSVSLPLIVFVAFVLGWLPMMLLHMASRASWRRRVTKVERLLDDALAPAPVAPPMSSYPAQGQPTVVPPAGA